MGLMWGNTSGATVRHVLKAYPEAAKEVLSDGVALPCPEGRTLSEGDVVMLKPGITQREATSGGAGFSFGGSSSDEKWVLRAGEQVTITRGGGGFGGNSGISVRDAQGA